MPMFLFRRNVHDIAHADDLLTRFRGDDTLDCGHEQYLIACYGCASCSAFPALCESQGDVDIRLPDPILSSRNGDREGWFAVSSRPFRFSNPFWHAIVGRVPELNFKANS